jgi:uncharacterized protein YceK
MRRLTISEFPKTRAGFVEKWNNDHVFRARALNMGFNVVFDCVFLPNGMIADKSVK